jgi:hypothetical protein
MPPPAVPSSSTVTSEACQGPLAWVHPPGVVLETLCPAATVHKNITWRQHFRAAKLIQTQDLQSTVAHTAAFTRLPSWARSKALLRRLEADPFGIFLQLLEHQLPADGYRKSPAPEKVHEVRCHPELLEFPSIAEHQQAHSGHRRAHGPAAAQKPDFDLLTCALTILHSITTSALQFI